MYVVTLRKLPQADVGLSTDADQTNYTGFIQYNNKHSYFRPGPLCCRRPICRARYAL